MTDDAFDPQDACGWIGSWVLGRSSVICRWALLVLSTVVVVSCSPSSLVCPLASPLEFPYPLDFSAAGSFTILLLDLFLLLRLPHHLLPLSFVVAWLATWCMSESGKVWVNSEDLEELCRAATQLASSAVRLASTASTQIGNQGVGSFVEIAKEEEPEGLKDREWVWRTKFNRIAEDGPPDVPEQLLDFGRYLLPCSAYSAHIRISEAFRAGFWARVAIDTVTPYQRIAPSPRVPAHWVVLRVGGHKPQARFENLTSFEEYIRGASETVLVYEVFQNIAEVHAFCHAARIFLPRCLVWRSTY